MRYLTVGGPEPHTQLIASSGGSPGVRDLGRIEAALAQPMATFDGEELYPSLAEKTGALGFALIQGHPFVDDNKRIGHAAVEVFLVLNGFELVEAVDEQERTILAVASGLLRPHVAPARPNGHRNVLASCRCFFSTTTMSSPNPQARTKQAWQNDSARRG